MTPDLRRRFIDALHRQGPHSPKGAFVLTGGGSLLLSDLLSVPGASETVVDACVPYAPEALTQYLGYAPAQACSATTACALAMAAYQRGHRLVHSAALEATSVASPESLPSEFDDDDLFGFSMTASLASTRPKRGAHRAHLALQSATTTWHQWVQLEKGKRSRAEEERWVADIALSLLTLAAGTAADNARMSGVRDAWQQFEPIHTDRVRAESGWQDLLTNLLRGVRGRTPARGSRSEPRVLFPGAFNPLHAAHRAMAEKAREICQAPVSFELCINNVDKPALDYIDIDHRLAQFDSGDSLWLTSYPTFVEKARAFPEVTFVVGLDTLLRIDEPRYYRAQTGLALRSCSGSDSIADGTSSSQREQNIREQNIDEAARKQALLEIGSLGCEFLVFPRRINGTLRSLKETELSPELRALCRSAGPFEHPVSSSELRRAAPKTNDKRH